jgi:copper chaperone CopZ
MAGSGHEKSAHGQDPVLPGGSYTAKAKSIVCGGCGSLIEKTMRGTPGIEAAKVDPKTGQVDFTVKKGQEVKWSELQKALKVSAGKMGMGADYTLTNFRVAGHPVDKAEAAPKALGPGEYTAKVKAIVCGGCGSFIEKSMRQVPGVSMVKADNAAATVQFSVAKGQTVSLPMLQEALRASAGQMGMGADYELYDIKPLKKAD